MELRVEESEDLLMPPLKEYTYICGDIVSETKCNGSLLFRDPDYVTLNMTDMIMSMSLQGALRSKLRGRKLDRWLSYVSKYRIEVNQKEFASVLKLGSVITLYVDGIDIDGISGDFAMKEIRVVGTGYNVDRIVDALVELTPRLITVQLRQGVWFMVTSYTSMFIDTAVKKKLFQFINIRRMVCKKIISKEKTRICYLD
ncbi:hypothetical protein [Sulfuracidifex metallicus]|uniref:Uncharacterized protein n=2 Tax=Sulfuracidifex metallicus TaxID=47303 RepID=A0A6A9QLI2_SULME|nr:hypothetical protein [Sulfuracidifex metallicus]MUN29404.1 hypothetical protein [Sulfuracidifex metallicus DSM 6482 = JCM 9184]WOE50084.1 hypothetical protein RQ359_001586 [Sulfuracidifex metallicus DSM 6482 = JCM 9184]